MCSSTKNQHTLFDVMTSFVITPKLVSLESWIGEGIDSRTGILDDGLVVRWLFTVVDIVVDIVVVSEIVKLEEDDWGIFAEKPSKVPLWVSPFSIPKYKSVLCPFFCVCGITGEGILVVIGIVGVGTNLGICERDRLAWRPGDRELKGESGGGDEAMRGALSESVDIR